MGTSGPLMHKRALSTPEAYNAASNDGAGAAVEVRSVDADGSVDSSGELLDKMLVLSMAGIAAEVIVCGSAEGGLADVSQARELMRAARSRRMTKRAAQDDRIRWGTLMALTFLQSHPFVWTKAQPGAVTQYGQFRKGPASSTY